MTRMNTTVCMYTRFSGTSRNSLTAQVAAEAMPMTNVTAMPMPRAVSCFFDTPINGQMPMNFTRMKFSARMAFSAMVNREMNTLILLPPPSFRPSRPDGG